MSCELAESRESGRRGRRAWTFAIPNLQSPAREGGAGGRLDPRAQSRAPVVWTLEPSDKVFFFSSLHVLAVGADPGNRPDLWGQMSVLLFFSFLLFSSLLSEFWSVGAALKNRCCPRKSSAFWLMGLP